MRKELARLQVKRQDVVFPVPEGWCPRQPPLAFFSLSKSKRRRNTVNAIRTTVTNFFLTKIKNGGTASSVYPNFWSLFLLNPFSILHSPFFTIHRSLFTVHRSLFTIHRSPFTFHHSPFTVHFSPFTVHRSLFTIHRSPFTFHHSPFTFHRSSFTTLPEPSF